MLLTLAAITLSFTRWNMEAYKVRHWMGETPEPTRELCPDGMGEQIRAFALFIEGDPTAHRRLGFFLHDSHQASTYLVGILGAPLVLLGLSPPYAFVVLSTLASLGLIACLWQLLGELFRDDRRYQLGALLLFLFHPAASRCLVRPQTDALLACFALSAVWLGRRARRPSRSSLVVLALAQSAALFVKIHALALLPLPVFTAYLHGVRGRRLVGVLVAGTLLPGLFWLAVFAGFDLFGTIRKAWEYKSTFYADWDLALVAEVIGWTSAPLLALLLLLRRRGEPAVPALLTLLIGYVALLVACGIPPLVRFQYPALAAAVVLGALALRDRFGAARIARAALFLIVCYQALLSLSVVFLFYYVQHVGPGRDLGGLDRFLYYLI
jgi:hypothetical protein